MVSCYLGLGSNISDRVGMIARAVTCLGSQGDIVLRRVSHMYLTKPWGNIDQDDFVNAVAAIETHLEPSQLLAKVKTIEGELGRRPTPRWGPREIDIDILLYGDRIVREDGLTIPHPYICERTFVLVPLVEIAPGVVHPQTGLKLSSYLEDITRDGEVSCRNLDI